MAEAPRADEDPLRPLEALRRVNGRPEDILRAVREVQGNAESLRHVWEGVRHHHK